MNNYDVLVVGMGPAGATVARRYAEKNKKVLLIDKKDHIAGHVFDKKNDKGLTYHVYGPHIFHTNDDQVIEYVTKFADFHQYKWLVNAKVEGKEVPLPINFKSIDLLFDKNKADSIKTALTKEFIGLKKTFIYDCLESKDPIVKEFGNYVFKNVFENYTTKMWGVKPDEIDRSVLRRVGIRLNYDDGYFDDKFQGAPIKGYAKLVENILNHPNITTKLNTDFQTISKFKDGKVYIKDVEYKGIVVFTGSLDELFDYKFGTLPYRSLLFDFENHNVEAYQERGVVNYPAHPTMTRITEYKKITLEKNSNWTVIGKEYPGQFDPKGKWKDRYYPIPNQENWDLHKKYVDLISEYKNVIFTGRLAEYKYKDMWLTFKDALNLKLI